MPHFTSTSLESITPSETKSAITLVFHEAFSDKLDYQKDNGEWIDLPGTELTIELNSDEYNASTLINIKDNENNIQTIEFLCQTEEQLQQKFGFTKKDGYITIGKCSFDLRFGKTPADIHKNEEIFAMPEDDQKYIRDSFAGQTLSHPPELAKAITEFIWEHYDHTGPSDKINPNMNSVEKLRACQEGASVQCAGTRDIFIDLACTLDERIRIRKVEAYRYPEMKNIIVNGHSILEIWSEETEDWFLFDPFCAVYFQSSSEELLSAADVREHRKNNSLETIEIKQLLGISDKELDPNDPKFYDQSEYNYFSHFGVLKYTELNYVLKPKILKRLMKTLRRLLSKFRWQ